MKICIIGSGVVGKATGDSFIAKKHEVTFNDISHDVLKKLHYHGFKVGDNTPIVVKDSTVVFICVNTPTLSNGEQDLEQVNSVLPYIVHGINQSDSPTTIILRSTVLPTKCYGVLEFLKRNIIDRTYQKDWNFFYNPEFLVAENAFETMSNPDRIVVGGEKASNWDVINRLYGDWNCEIIKTGLGEAEMIKYASNCFLAMKISYFNQIGIVANKYGLDIKTIERAVSLDKRIGNYGTISGRAYGGACFPKDTKAFSTFMKNVVPFDLVKTAIFINEDME